MSATTTVRVRDLLPGDVVVSGRCHHRLAEIHMNGLLCLLLDAHGVGRLAHADAEVRVACADVPPIKEVLDA